MSPTKTHRGKNAVHCTILSLRYSSMIGLAIQLAPKSHANSVIRFGRYCFSRKTQGKIIVGTSGVSEKIAGSQRRNTPSRSNVVRIISDTKARMYPNVNDTWNVPICRVQMHNIWETYSTLPYLLSSNDLPQYWYYYTFHRTRTAS